MSPTAIGRGTISSNDQATAMGVFTVASGLHSTAMGSQSMAQGTNSTAMGWNTIANGYASLVVGGYNDTIVAAQTSISSGTPLFIVGNGTFADRSNALAVFENGQTHAEALRIGDGTVLTEVQSGTASIGTNPGGGVKSVSVSFPDGAFQSAPRVICTIRAGNYVDTFVVSTRQILTTSFTVNVYRVDNGGGNWGQVLQMDWIAIK